MEYLLIELRSTVDQFSPPDVFYTSERIPNFFQMRFGQTINQIAMESEAYLLSGVHG